MRLAMQQGRGIGLELFIYLLIIITMELEILYDRQSGDAADVSSTFLLCSRIRECGECLGLRISGVLV